jgi:hypothetical protein
MDLPVELVGLLKHAGIDGKKLTSDLQVNSSAISVKLMWIKAEKRVNCLPIKLLIVWVDRSLICVNVVCGGLVRRCVARFVYFLLLWKYYRLSVFQHMFYCHQRLHYNK